jgi:hypothetical protein
VDQGRAQVLDGCVADAVPAALAADKTPLHLPLGDDAVDAVLSHLGSVHVDIAAWEKTARGTAFDD